MKRPQRTHTTPTTPEDIVFLEGLNAAYGTPQTPQEQAANTAPPIARQRHHVAVANMFTKFAH